MLLEMAIHPGEDDLYAYRQGKLDAGAAAAIEEHLSACDTCCDALERTDDSFAGRLRSVTARTDEAPAELVNHSRYRVLRLLGRGGMGAVYLAEHLRMGRQVALKIIHPELLRHPAALARFQQEVRAAARLDHPNIVVSHDADQAGGLHFLVMEHVDGRNLADHLAEQGPLPVHQACDIIRQAALGLEHAHRLGMIHRDIKPHNLMLTATGQVKVLDFGLALLKEEGIDMNATACERDDALDLADCRLTRTGAVMGTVDYVAPEQARDPRRADGRADVYSLGCTLYQLIAGQVPFPGGDAADKLTRLAENEPISLTKARSDVPEEVAAVVGRMLAKRPEDRYATPAAVAQALAPFTSAMPRRSRFLRRAVLGVALFALMAAAAFAAGVVRLPLGNDRELVIETDDPAIEVIVKGERIVRIIDPKTGKAYQLDRDNLTLSLADDLDGLSVTLDGKTPIVLRRQGKRFATVRLVNKGDKVAGIEPAKQAHPAPADLPARTGFRSLFNRKDLIGWHVENIDLGRWSVEGDAIVGRCVDFKSRNYLLTKDDYADFTLRLEYMLEAGSAGGVVFRAVEGQKILAGGNCDHPTLKLTDPAKYPNYPSGTTHWVKNDKQYDRPAVFPELAAEVWHTLELTARGDTCIALLDGKNVVDVRLDPAAGNNPVPALRRTKGRIGFQAHTGTIRFRRVQIKELPALAMRGGGQESSEEPEPAVPAETSFFNGKNLFGWQGLPGYWKIHNGAIIGAPADGIKAHTFLCSERTYKDFELKFKVRRKNGVGNSGVQFRSQINDRERFTVRGPQIEIDSATFRNPPGSIVTEPTGPPRIHANAAAIAKVWKDDGFNNMTIRCVGKHVTVTVNGVVAVDADFPTMPAEGIIAWQLHGGLGEIASPEEVVFKDIHFTDLSRQPSRFLDPAAWHGLEKHWTIKDGVITGAAEAGQLGDAHTFLCSKKTYRDFEMKFQVRLSNDGFAGNSGVQIRSKLIDADRFIVQGPQCDMGGGEYWGSLYGERMGGMMKQAPWKIVADNVVRPGAFNDYFIRCVGKRVTIRVNGVTTVDDAFTELPDEGIIAWQLHNGGPMSVTFKNVEFKELNRADERVLREFFEKNRAMFDGSQVRAKHILVKADDGDKAAGRKRLLAINRQLIKEVDRVLAQLPANADPVSRENERVKALDRAFTELARTESACPSRSQGGDIGWISRLGAVVEPFARAAFDLQPFELSEPVATKFGYHLLMVVERRPGKHVTFDDIKHIVAEVRNARLREANGDVTPPLEVSTFGHLFNGKDLAGWTVDGKGADAWRVLDGDLVTSSEGYLDSAYLLTEKSYADFRMILEYRLSPGANSGVALRAIPGEREPRWNVPHHLEVQILDDNKHRKADGTVGSPTGALYWSKGHSNLRPERLADLRPAGQWNEMIIELRGDRLRVWVNGDLLQDTYLSQVAKLPEALPGLRRKQGRIGLQRHSGEVRFRKVWIEELPPLAETSPSSRSTSAYRGPWQKFEKDEKAQRFWHDYGDALKRYYEQPMPAAMPILPGQPGMRIRC